MSSGSEQEAKRDLFRSAFDTLSSRIVVLDADGTIVTANDAWIEFAERSGVRGSPHTPGSDYFDALGEIDERYASRIVDGLTALLDRTRERFELEYPHGSGDERRWVLLRAAPFTHQGGEYVTVSHVDITERKGQERALRDAYEISTASGTSLTQQVEELLAVARGTIGTECATLSQVEDDRYLFETVTAATGAPIEAGDTVPLTELPNCKHVVETRETLVLRDVEAEAPELADPTWGIASYLGAPVIVEGEVYGTLCFYSTEPRAEAFSAWAVTFVDLLSKWVSYELERRDREEKLQQLRENVTDVVWMSTPEKDEIEFVSDAYRDVWGRPPDSLRRDPAAFVEGIHPEDRARVETALEEQRERPDQYEETYRVVRPDGDVRWVHDRASGVFADGELQRIIGTATDITDREERERELAYQTALLEAQAETTIDGLLVVDSDRSVRYHNDRFLDVWEIPETAAADRSDEALLEFVDDRLANPERFREQVEYLYDHPKEQSRDTIELTDGRWIDRYSAPVIGEDGTHYGRLWAFRDITERKQHERALERQRDELIQLQRVNTLVRRTVRALQDTTTREGIETAVCEALTESDLYQTAWTGDWTESEGGDRIVRPRTTAGIEESYLDGIREFEGGPSERALQTGEVQVIDDISTSDSFPDGRRETALARSHQSLAAVPLTKEGATYGVLAVYAPPDHAIGETEREILADLGRSIALAIQRVHSQHSLTAETVVSLHLRIPDTQFVFGTASTDLDAEIALERRVATGDGVIYYLGVSGVDPTRVRDYLRGDSLITACTVVRDGDSALPALVEAHLAEEPRLPLDVLTDYGATVTDARAVDGDIQLRIELPSEVDVRTVLAAVRELAPSLELVSKRHVDRETKTAAAMQNHVTARLTDKQRASLEAAYARGYYTWPRESTMEEIAEAFDVSAPTLHYRLRKAHDTVVGSLLDSQRCEED